MATSTLQVIGGMFALLFLMCITAAIYSAVYVDYDMDGGWIGSLFSQEVMETGSSFIYGSPRVSTSAHQDSTIASQAPKTTCPPARCFSRLTRHVVPAALGPGHRV